MKKKYENEYLKAIDEWIKETVDELQIENKEIAIKMLTEFAFSSIRDEKQLAITSFIKMVDFLDKISPSKFDSNIQQLKSSIAENSLHQKELLSILFYSHYIRNKEAGNDFYFVLKNYIESLIFINIRGTIEDAFAFSEDIYKKLKQELSDWEFCIVNGLFLYSNSNDDEALDQFCKASFIRTDRPEPHYFSGLIYIKKNNWVNAINSFEKALSKMNSLEIDFFKSKCLFKLSILYTQTKDFKNALVTIQNYLKKNETDSEGFYILSYLHYKLKEYSSAIKNINKAIDNLDEESKEEYYWLKIAILEQTKQYREAIDEVNKLKSSSRSKKKIDKTILRINNKINKPEKIENNKTLEPENNDDLIQIDSFINKDTQSFIPTKDNSISSEMFIEDFLYDRISKGEKTFGQSLNIYKGENPGRQFPTPIGIIDLLVKNEDNDFIVIEIKKGKSDDIVFGQISRYMGWVKKNLVNNDANVYGIIYTFEASEKLKSAKDSNENVKIHEYKNGWF